MNRGEIYRTKHSIQERGDKPGFYVIVSRDFVAENPDLETVVCAPIFSEVLGIRSEVVLGTEDGLPRTCAIRCDFLMLLFKSKLTTFAATLSSRKMHELNRAISYALQITG
jgi:mRNA-degrading endonuclease toxin of MazEF toxin-antitoxin module